MNFPSEAHWARVEELVSELDRLAPDQAAARLAEIAEAGESASVLTLLDSWRRLPARHMPAFQPGLRLGPNYVLAERIGQGGMGVVWRAHQTTVERDVAIKLIHPAFVSPAVTRRFQDEIRVLGRLDHPGIVRLFDAGLYQDETRPPVPYLVMELVEGTPLDTWARDHRDSPRELLALLGGVCEAVQSAHEHHIVHRDLKPANILVRKNGRPVVLDFGIARLVGTEDPLDEGGFVGTPHYAAPEQFTGRDRDFRSGESVDIYALGAVLFEVLTGRRLLPVPPGATLAQVRHAVLEEPPPRLEDQGLPPPDDLREIVARATRRDPSERFYSVASLGRALQRVSSRWGNPEPATPPWKPAVDALLPGSHWRLLERLGEGGTGEVWLGEHTQLRLRRVFKFCDTAEKARTLRREYTLYRLLKERLGRHPHFVQLHEVSLDEPPWFLMMDFEDARDLADWTAARPGGLADLPTEIKIEILAQAAETLQAAHDAGILHRDLKPANLLVRDTTPTEISPSVHVLVADFGLGQLLLDDLRSGSARFGFTRTVSDLQTSRLAGTLLYLAPEVLEGQPASARSDLYSLGVVLWQLLVGNLNAALDPADWANRITDPLLRDDLQRCLAGAPEKRWSSAGEFAASLRNLPARRSADLRRRSEIAAREHAAYRRGALRTAAAAALVLAVLLGAGLLAWHQSRRATQAAAAADQLALSSMISQLDALSRTPQIDRRPQALALVNRLTTQRAPRSTVFLDLANAYYRVLAEPDWHLQRRLPPRSPGLLVTQLAGDPASGSTIVRHSDASIDVITAHGTRSLRSGPTVPSAPGPLAIASNASWIATADGNSVLLYHGAEDPTPVQLTFGAPVTSLAWSSDAGLLAVGRQASLPDNPESGGVIELRRAPDWRLSATLARTNEFPFSRPPTGLRFSPDDAWLLDWSSESLQVHVWSVPQAHLAASAYHPAPVPTATWIRAAEFLTASADGQLYQWRFDTESTVPVHLDQAVARFPQSPPENPPPARAWTSVVLDPAGRFALATTENGQLLSFDLTTGERPHLIPGTTNLVDLVAVLAGPSSNFIAITRDGALEDLEFLASTTTFTLTTPHVGTLEDFDAAPHLNRFAVGGMNGVALFEPGKPLRHHFDAMARTRGLRFLDDDTLLVSSRFTNQLVAWTPDSNPAATTESALADTSPGTPFEGGQCLALDLSGHRIALARPGRIRVGSRADFATNSIRLGLPSQTPVRQLAFSPDGRRLAWVDQENRAYLWRDSGSAPELLAEDVHSVAWSGPHRCCLAGPTAGGQILTLFDHKSAATAPRHTFLPGAHELAATASGNLIAATIGSTLQLGRLSPDSSPPIWQPLVTLAATPGEKFSHLRFVNRDRLLGAVTQQGYVQFWFLGEILGALQSAGCLPSDAPPPSPTPTTRVPRSSPPPPTP